MALENLVGSTRIGVRALPERADADARIDAFWTELERNLQLDGCPGD